VDWAQLLRRTFGFDVFTGERCGGRRRVLASLYVPDAVARDALVARLSAMGYPPVEPENPYWTRQGVTVEDPDGWRVVLQNTRGIGP